MSELPPPPIPVPPPPDGTDSEREVSRSHRTIAESLIDHRSSVDTVAVSPDGEHLAFVVATIDLARNITRTTLWLDDAPVSAGDHDEKPAWSPDGRFLAFTSRRGEKDADSTVHVLSIGGPGELRTLCTMPDGVDDVAWSPDGRWIAFTSRTRHGRYDAKDASWQAPRKIERFFSRLNGEDWIFDRPNHVYVIAADGTGAPRNLTPGEFQHAGVSWLADSSGIVTASRRHATWDRDQVDDLYVVPMSAPADGADDDGIRCLTAHDGIYSHPAVSPDGTLVAFVGHGEPLTGSQNAKVGVLPITSTGATESQIRWVSAGFDRTFETTLGAPAPVWESDTHLLALAEDRGETHLYRMPADGSFVPAKLTSGALNVNWFGAAHGTVATVRSTVDRPGELFGGDEQLTRVSEEFSARLVGWERFTARTTDGTDEIDAWLMRPADFDETKRYPVLLNVHGGPHTQYGEYFFDEFQMQAAAGFVVVLGNPRGGSGRHTAWGQAILGPHHPVAPGTGWGSVDVDDVLAVLDTALDRYEFCDPERVGMLGGSYGGFMATWLAAYHGDRFRAFCSERAVNNLTSEEWSSDIATAFVTEHGVSHLDAPEAYERRSPVRAVRDIDKPLLIIHSEEDWRCPIVQAEELWVAMRLLDKDVDFYRFPGENHELSRSGSPIHRVQRAEIILDWFAAKLA